MELKLEIRLAMQVAIEEGDPDSHYLLWHDLEAERHAIQKALPEAVAVYGTLDLDVREQAVIDFSDGKFKYLSTKPEISGSGCNFQRHCHKAIFLGIGYKFNDFIQSVHRIYRFLQTDQVEIHIIHSEAEREILRALQTKWDQHNRMVENMSQIIKEHGLNSLSMNDVLARTIGVERIEVSSDLFTVANNDCVIEARMQPENHCDLIVTSIPFANHYEYTPSYNDFGHTENNDHFWRQMDYLTPELLRILKPGRLYCCHVKDRILFGNVTGAGAPNLGADPEMRYMPNGDAVANLRIATTESWKDKQTGEKKELTEWHRVVFYRKLAEIAGQYLKKGASIYIEGRIRTRKWQGQDGQDRYTTEIEASDMQMLGGRRDGNTPPPVGSATPPAQNDRPAGSTQGVGGANDFEDDIPF